MAYFYIYERVPCYVEYRKRIEAETLEEAKALALTYADVDAEEVQLDPDDVIDGLAIEHDAEAVEG